MARSVGRTPQIFTSGWTLLFLWLCRVPQQFWRISKPQQGGVVSFPPMMGSPHAAVTTGLSPTTSCPPVRKETLKLSKNNFGLWWSRAPWSRLSNPKGSFPFRLLQTCACPKDAQSLDLGLRRMLSHSLLCTGSKSPFHVPSHISAWGYVCCRQG